MATHTFDIAFCTFPYTGVVRKEAARYMVTNALAMRREPRVGRIIPIEVDDTPITMARNLAVRTALDEGADFIMMLDSDMSPDCELDESPDALPFFDSTFEFMVEHYHKNGPCVVFAPYCGVPPTENIYVFRWCNTESHAPGVGGGPVSLEQFTREDAAMRTGFEQVGAGATGLIIYDARIFRDPHYKPEWFYYDYGDEFKSNKASTEDVANLRDISSLGYPVYVNWHAWAAHMKVKKVRKPVIPTLDSVGRKYADAVESRRRAFEKRVIVKPGVIPTLQREVIGKEDPNGEEVQPSGDGRVGIPGPPILWDGTPIEEDLQVQQADEGAAGSAEESGTG